VSVGTSRSEERAWPALLDAAANARAGRPHQAIAPGKTTAAQELVALHQPLIDRMAEGHLTVGQLGQSLDGRIATAGGDSYYVTGEANRTHLHRLRALVDAVVVGAGTVLHDDPQLTVRACAGEHPTRVVIDSRGQLTPDHRLFQDRQAPTLIYRGAHADAAMGSSEVAALAIGDDGYDPEALLADLHARGLRHVLVEGGGVTVSRFLAAGLLDRLHVCIAPLIIGSGRAAVSLPEIARLSEARRPPMRTFAMPPDTLFDCDLRG
jgi:riboflavin-specific deaminase-like protein